MKAIFKIFAVLATVILPHTSMQAETRRVSLPEVGDALKSAAPGDTVIVRPGTYSDMELKWCGNGTQESPVTVIAEEAGKTVISGKSTLRISGSHLTVSSFLFKDGVPVKNKGALIEFKDKDNLAGGCRLTNCIIDSYNSPDRSYPSSYVHLYGRHNRVDHNSFIGKTSLGVTLTVLLNHDGCDENEHIIENNYFGYRPVYGSNGAETIRVGTSQQCMQNSRTIIRNNLFYRCNGEVEVISIKSCENVISGNTLYECEGVLALRHGDRNTASDNLFIGNGRRNTGGIRIVGEDQIVRGNRLFSLGGERFFSALALMSAVPNSLPNRYMQVKGCLIEENIFTDCKSLEYGTGKDYERTLAPENNTFKNNVVYNEEAGTAVTMTAGGGINVFKGNRAKLATQNLQDGFKPYKGEKPQLEAKKEDIVRGIGAGWSDATGYNEEIMAHQEISCKSTIVKAENEEELYQAVEKAADGTVILLTGKTYILDKAVKVKNAVTIKAEDGVRPEFRFAGRRSDNMVTIADGADLEIRDIFFNGVLTPGRSLAKAAISTSQTMCLPYNLRVENCRFENYGESGFIPVKGTKGTFAGRVEIRGCHFEALSGDAINYAAENEDKGKYNADDMIIENCTFERILGIPVNICRGGSDESTAGPYVFIRDCKFNDCCNKVRGSVLRITGAQILEITGCSFNDSGRGGYAIRLDDAPWEKITVSGLQFNNSGKILSNRDL